MDSPKGSNIDEFAKHQDELFPYTAQYLGQRNLDIGSGTGLAALAQQQKLGISVTLSDVVDIRDEAAQDLPFSLIQNNKLPFEDASFDSAYLQYVLHHIPTEDLLTVLSEAFRVANRTVIVEEVKGERTDLEKARKFDEDVNHQLHDGIHMPLYKHYSSEEIKELCGQLGHHQIEHKVISEGLETDGYLETHLLVFE